MKLLLFFDVVGHVAGRGDIRLLHSDIHVISLDCLEHRLTLVSTERLKFHARLLHSLLAIPWCHFFQRVVLVLDDKTLLTVADWGC